MDDEDMGVVVLSVICFAFGVMLGVMISNKVTNESWNRELIEREFAEYDAKTGDWKWKEEPNQ